jgi:hypothetical protein
MHYDARRKISCYWICEHGSTVRRMRMIPTHCVGCGTFALTCATLLSPRGSAICQCGATAHALPGASYGPEDQLLFDAIVFSMKASGVTWQNARRLLLVLEDCRSSEPMIRLRVLKQFSSALAVIEIAVAESPAVARKAIALFELLLEAIAQTEGHSGLLTIGSEARRARLS